MVYCEYAPPGTKLTTNCLCGRGDREQRIQTLRPLLVVLRPGQGLAGTMWMRITTIQKHWKAA